MCVCVYVVCVSCVSCVCCMCVVCVCVFVYLHTCNLQVQRVSDHDILFVSFMSRVKELRRESSQSSPGASFGQAMNLLMNIPITAPPSIFHPSNVLSTSTPVRPNLSRHHPQPAAAAADISFDPAETPIRGHNVPIKPGSKPHPRPRFDGSAGHNSSHSQSSNKRRWQPPKAAWQSGGAAEPQQAAVVPPHPEASPSESDQTDTDSNNVTHPTEIRPAPSQPNIPVIGSTDTEFDFPTSDFNNIDDQLNDLNQGRNNLNKAKETQGSEGRGQPRPDQEGRGLQSRGDQASAAAASSPRLEAQKPAQTAEIVTLRLTSAKPLSTRTNIHPQSPSSPAHRQGSSASPTTAGSKQSKNSQNLAEKGPVPLPRQSSRRDVPSAEPKTTTGEPGGGVLTNQPTAGCLRDSFDDELLFAGPGDSQAPKPDSQGSPLSGGTSSGGKVNAHLMNVLPAVMTALSSDLTTFAQRSPLRNGGERVAGNQSPGDHRLAAHPHHPNLSALPRHSERLPVSTGISGQPIATGVVRKSWLPSPRAAAIRDWASQTGDHGVPGCARQDKKRADSQPEKTGAVSTQDGSHLFAAYSSTSHSPRNQGLAEERQRWKASSQTQTPTPRLALDADDPTVVGARADYCQGLSGPSSDPIVPDRSPPSSAHGAKNTPQSQHSNSLPTQPSPASAKRDPKVNESHPRNATSDNLSTATASALPSTATKATTTSVLVTEKLLSGAVFSPIHPQPVSSSGTVSAGQLLKGNTSHIVHPKPVAGIPSELTSPLVMTPSAFTIVERDQAR